MTALFSWTNHVDRSGAALSASQTAGDLTPSNMASPQVAIFWRTTSLTAWGQVDFGADVSIGCLALRFHREGNSVPPETGTVQHQLDADGGTAGTGAVYDSTAISINCDPLYGYHLHVPTTAQTARYWRFTFASITDVSFLDVGRAWAGNAFQPTIDIGYPHEDAWGDRSLVTSTGRAGVEFVDDRCFQRIFGISMGAIDATDRESVRSMLRATGLSSQLLFCLDPSTADGRKRDTIIGRRSQNRSLNRAIPSGPALYSTSLSIRESL